MFEPSTSDEPERDRGKVELDEATRTLRVDGCSIPLTPTQFSIVAHLVRVSPRWVTAREIIERVLGTHHQRDTALIRVHVFAIRQRLGSAARYLEADQRYWRGYRFTMCEAAPTSVTRPCRRSTRR